MTAVALKSHLSSPLMARLIPYLALFGGMMTVMVDDTSKLESLVKKIKTVKGVKQVNRG